MSQSRNRRRTRAQSHSPSFQLSLAQTGSLPQSVSQSGQYVSEYPRTRRPPPPPTQQRSSPPSIRRASSPPILPAPNLPASLLPPPQPQALLRSILEHFLARKPDLEALCFNSLRCAANFAIPLFNNNCIPHSYHSGCLSASHLSSLSPVSRSHPEQSAEKGTTNTRGGLLSCSDLLSSARLSSALFATRLRCCCCTLQTLPLRPLPLVEATPDPEGPCPVSSFRPVPPAPPLCVVILREQRPHLILLLCPSVRVVLSSSGSAANLG